MADRGTHVLYISRTYGSQHGGSAYSAALLDTLVRAGVEVTLVAESLEGSVAHEGVHTMILPAFFRSGLAHAWARLRDATRLLRLACGGCAAIVVQGDLPRLTYVLLQCVVPLLFIRQDVILTCPANTRFLPRSRRICSRPVGFSCLSVNREEGCLASLVPVHRLGRIIYRLRDKALLGLLRHFVVNSAYVAGCHRRGARVVWPPNLASPSPAGAASRNLTQVVFCGRLEGTKGAEDAVRIAALLPSRYTLQILGDGPDKESLASLAQALGVAERVHFAGWVDADERDAVFASSGVLLLPSLWAEAFGMVGVEAFTQGTPVVAYDTGGVSEWCLPPGGHLVPCGDIQAAAAAVQRLTGSAEEWGRCSAAALSTASERHARARFGREVISLMKQEAGLVLD